MFQISVFGSWGVGEAMGRDARAELLLWEDGGSSERHLT